jgi:hypothetical protein
MSTAKTRKRWNPTKTIETWCPNCRRTVEAQVQHIHTTLRVCDEMVSYVGLIAKCPHCGTDIGDSHVVGEDLQLAYDAYERLFGKDPRI